LSKVEFSPLVRIGKSRILVVLLSVAVEESLLVMVRC
jgi:hypothetical protein